MEVTKQKTRMELRHEVLTGYPNEGILTICQGIHTALVGDGPSLHEEEINRCIKFLNMCLASWCDINLTTEYDAAVKTVIEVTLKELKEELLTRENDNEYGYSDVDDIS